METSNTAEITEVEYPQAKLYKRWFAFFIDVFVMSFLGAVFYGLTALVTDHIPAYQSVSEERTRIQVDSGLYNADDVLILTEMSNSRETYESKKNYLSQQLDFYYQNKDFFSDDKAFLEYQNRKKNCQDEQGNLLFYLDGSLYKENGTGSDKAYYDFYYQEISDYAMPEMSALPEYSRVTKLVFRIHVIEAILCFAIGFVFSFCMMPFILKRGRQTLGMYLFKISLIGADALNVNGKTLVFRLLLLFFIGYVLDIFTVFIPLLVSLTMMHLSKRHQDFFDYVTNTYVIDSAKKTVYYDYYEYERSQIRKASASLENTDFHLK